ncbi:ribosome maturation factor RimP [Actinacidiphila bryophytorum]|uniref:Ribosome maturation factor RimP n=1 Tax=Actinacidiphila bryophytorum TaxID=1436133 RepID=A0A9W4E1Y1_9ACTN|nr:ribosome maturation factor RimP [Actinacidiphila bryophytorum]MBM9435608.1 ribosome maturation factor RimP [Actinacidiphila bryophytorum]MBN6544093.1 ribosome maturation factor RimP [Actinacidiphila bryophytorum]CAG7609981.1 Ribosome maturation factor RimP [Actinacidiphila bryophytorum]
MSTTQSERLRALLEPLVGEAGLDLEDVTLTASGRRRQLLVVVDAEDGVELDTVAAVSRTVSQALDDSDVMGEAEYVLEVTSPGTDRPLTEPRHFRRNTGRLVKLALRERGELIARIMAVDETGLDLEVPGVKGRKPKPARADFAEIAKARVEVEFSRKAGGPDDLGDQLDDGDDPGDGGDDDGGSDIDESTQEA